MGLSFDTERYLSEVTSNIKKEEEKDVRTKGEKKEWILQSNLE